jgi:signal transduction histidine kinase/CheY-like chemotaxis protein
MRAPYDTNVSLSAPPESTVVSYKVCRQGVELRPSELPAQIAAASGRPVIAQEYELVFPDGRTVRLLMGAEPLFDASGRVRGSVVTGVDMTELRTAEIRLQHAQKLESIGLLAGGIAHDFNNLLVGVIGNASLAQNMLPQDHPVLEILAHVIKAGDEAAHLTRQMLAYAGKGKFVVEPLDLSRLIPEMSGLVQPSISKKIDLRFNLEPNLPAIEADRSQIQQIFMNLVLNAAEAIGDESGVITVNTSSQSVGRRSIKQVEVDDIHPGEYVCLKVSDTGCGMDAATRAKIFDPFFSTKFTGRGLGLAAVSGIVRGHSGSITVESTQGKGTNFTILFPTTKKAVAASVSSVASPNLHGSGTILVVDDEEAVRQVVRKTLEHYGYRVLLAKNGGEAIDVFKREPSQISLVILDLSMPGMSGNETLPELRRIRPEVKVLVSSGYTEDETMSLFTGQRVSGFLQKPYIFTRLAEKIRAALE